MAKLTQRKAPAAKAKAAKGAQADTANGSGKAHVDSKQGGGRDDEDDDSGDWASMLLLLLLYTLQGIPMGLSSSIPFILQEKVGYADQATFSLVSWPFSLKLLWAPFVDSLYSRRFGRRKSWLIPVQFICAALMIGGSWIIGDLLGETPVAADDAKTPIHDGKPHVVYLTLFFFVLYFMMATQDIAVDGWALTMLSKRNVAHASTCNSVGQTLGFFVAYVGFLALHDPATCNTYFRSTPQDEGIIGLPGFMHFWGWVMFVTTVGVWLFKAEKQETSDDDKLSIKDTYLQMYAVMRLPSVVSLSVMLLTCKIGFAAAESVAALKLVEYGMKKEKLAMLSPVLIPLGIIIPVFLGRFIKPDKPLNLFLLGYPFRMLCGLFYAGIVYMTPSVMAHHEDVHFYFYGFILLAGAFHELVANMMYVPQMAFFARISDPSIGGTYMTFLNTITNLGSKWPNSVSLWAVDYLTTRECLGHDETVLAIGSHTCSNADERAACTAAGGECLIIQDGFFLEIAVCTVLGVLWLVYFHHRIGFLQNLKVDKWRIANGSD
uniref:Acetyl-coenzyme A transporter 1 n=1 Tax=Globisporangium ultimum (strain ATCC 200006 / CBS 805.95 / DAOM BR144) TaxID=431595 RepID=K3WIB8_GLOUD